MWLVLSIHLPCFYVRGNVNHPNYYLGPILGSVCDTLRLGVDEMQHDFHFSVAPNPNDANFKISYLLPQNESGKLEVLDVNGKSVYERTLPSWSTMQYIQLPEFISSSIYNCHLTSESYSVSRKLVVVR